MVRVINTEKKNEMIWKVSVEIQRFIKKYVVLSQYYATFLKSLERFSNSFQELRSQRPLKMKIKKTNVCWSAVLLFDYNDEKIDFLTKILFLNEI